MHTTTHWVPQRVPSWVSQTIIMAVVLLLLWAERMDDVNWWGQIYLLFLWANLMIFWRRRLYVISAGVLLSVQAPVATQVVPLAAAEAKRLRTEWYIRWMDGKRPQSLRVKYRPEFDTHLEQALDLARADDGAPRTIADAQARVAIATAVGHAGAVVWALVAAIAALVGLAVLMNQPLVMAPLLLLPYGLHRYNRERYYVIAPDGLWVAPVGQQPTRIPLEQIHCLTTPNPTVISTSHPDYPELRVHTANSFDFLKVLKRMKDGEAPPQSAPVAPIDGPAAPPQGQVRCSLCGRPMAQGLAPAGSVHICDTCANRARLEAQEGGHGPSPRPERPIG